MLKLLNYIKIFKDWSHFIVLLKDLGIISNELSNNEEHISAAMEWLCCAQDITDCGGVSAGYSLRNGWRNAYPETTGYIIQTFLKYSLYTDNKVYIKRATKMGDWEIEIQLSNGAVRGGVGFNTHPVVFNTGQVILGWVDLYKETNLERFKTAAMKAANWLLEIQDDDGKWSQYVYRDIPHSYHTEVAWGLLELYKITGIEKYKTAAKKNIIWVLSNSMKNGWFTNTAFTKEHLPITHTIGYTFQGLLESAEYFESELKNTIVKIVNKACVNIMLQYEENIISKRHSTLKYLQASFDENWRSPDKYSCLPGSCQIAICFIELYKINNDRCLLKTATKIIDHVKSTQIFKIKNKGIQGGISGSFPIWGKYQSYNYPNWATKYFVDALLLLQENQI